MSKVNLFAGFVFRPVRPPLLAFLASWLLCVSLAAQTTKDCSDTSVRAAAGNGGSYFFDCGTNAATIALTNTIVVTADVTLDGAGQSIVISGGNAVRLFIVNPGVNFTLKNLVLASGKAAGDDGTNGVAGDNAAGAGIYNDGGSVTLINCTLRGHAVTGGNGGNGVVQLNGSGGNGGRGGDGGNASGGAIANAAGTVLVYDCTFTKNGVTGASGGIGGNGTGIKSNGANGTPGGGLSGGIFNDSGRVTVLFSTFNNNTATGANGGDGKAGVFEFDGGGGTAGSPASGGGIGNNGGTLWMTNCTFFGNSVVGGNGGNGGDGGTSGVGGNGGGGGGGGAGNGGGVFNTAGGTNTAVNCTISNNSAQGGAGGSGGAAGSLVMKAGRTGGPGENFGGGIANRGGLFTLQNTLVGRSLLSSNAAGAITDGGYNLIDDNSLALAAAGSRTSSNLFLGVLSSNGGLTQTVPVRSNSPAINAGNDAFCLPTDQRHYARSGRCDIGAYEFNGFVPSATLNIRRQTNLVMLWWTTAVPGYSLQSNPTLSRTNWTALTNVPVVVTNTNVVTDTASDPRRFYRLVK